MLGTAAQQRARASSPRGGGSQEAWASLAFAVKLISQSLALQILLVVSALIIALGFLRMSSQNVPFAPIREQFAADVSSEGPKATSSPASSSFSMSDKVLFVPARFGDVSAIPEVSTHSPRCKPGCYSSGTCNEEESRCDCMPGFAADDCSGKALPACHHAPTGHTFACFLPGPCPCTEECRRLFLATPEVCFETQGLPEGAGMADILAAPQARVSERRQQAMMEEAMEEEDPNRVHLLPPADCPNECSGVGACTEDKNCTCPWFRNGDDCGDRSQHFCINDCSGLGDCVDGHCKCRPGTFGIDCSLFLDADGKTRFFLFAPFVWTDVLAAPVNVFTPPRPQIYVYDLPGHFNTWQFLHSPPIDLPESLWFLERLLNSAHRTTDPNAADLFYMPLVVRNRENAKLELLQGAISYVSSIFPFWNRKGGTDHIFFINDPMGRCNIFPHGVGVKVLASSIVLSPFGFSGNLFFLDDLEPCFKPGQDVVVPPALTVHEYRQVGFLSPDVIDKDETQRTIFLLFVKAREHDRYKDEKAFSLGARQRFLELYEGKREAQEAGFVIETRETDEPTLSELQTSVFYLATIGEGWHRAAVLSIFAGCIPVIVQPGVVQPFEEGDYGLDWSEVSIRLDLDDLPRLPEILKAVTQEKIQQMVATMRKFWLHLTWTSAHLSPLPEQHHDRLAPELAEKDAFSTIMKVLRGRLEQGTPSVLK